MPRQDYHQRDWVYWPGLLVFLYSCRFDFVQSRCYGTNKCQFDSNTKSFDRVVGYDPAIGDTANDRHAHANSHEAYTNPTRYSYIGSDSHSTYGNPNGYAYANSDCYFNGYGNTAANLDVDAHTYAHRNANWPIVDNRL